MGKVIASIWQSADGIIDSASMGQWFEPFHSESRGDYINKIIHDCDAMLYGRVTYELLSSYWSQHKDNEFGIADKLNKGKKYLVSSSPEKAIWENTTVISTNIPSEIQKIKDNTDGNILLQGSATLVEFLIAHNLIDELKLLIHPYLVGNGKRLFRREINKELELVEFLKFDFGVYSITYAPKNI